jgi:predicted alpha/beta hydrolase
VKPRQDESSCDCRAVLAFADGSPDGVNLKGTHFSSGRCGPAILLLHQCNMDRHAWGGLAADLAGNGFHVLAIDYCGYGERRRKVCGRGAKKVRGAPVVQISTIGLRTCTRRENRRKCCLSGSIPIHAFSPARSASRRCPFDGLVDINDPAHSILANGSGGSRHW